MKTIHCCEMMDAGLKSGRDILEYNPRMREYYALCRNDDGFTLYYCPFCGTKLPESVRDLWFDNMRKVFGNKASDLREKDIPLEFRTDEWWKKRGL